MNTFELGTPSIHFPSSGSGGVINEKVSIGSVNLPSAISCGFILFA